jgi:prepilin-type processing-associated H-X9-DG protein
MARLDSIRLSIYICPSVSRWEFHNPRRDYFGVVGGRTLFAHGWRGDIFNDGVMYMNSFTPARKITDGMAKTFCIGESEHASRWGAGEGYGDGCVGGPATWWFGGATTVGDPKGLSVGRVLRSTKHPVNSSIYCIASDEDNDAPFTSEHSGGAHFAYCDGHVLFVPDDIDWRVYQGLSTRAGAEVASGP